jgi:hypothetical protein
MAEESHDSSWREALMASRLADAWHTIVPAPDDPAGPLPPLLVALTVVTGLVDAFSYLTLGHVFTANVTGNIVFLGFALAGAPGFSVAASLTAYASFAAGSVLGGRLAVVFSATASGCSAWQRRPRWCWWQARRRSAPAAGETSLALTGTC